MYDRLHPPFRLVPRLRVTSPQPSSLQLPRKDVTMYLESVSEQLANFRRHVRLVHSAAVAV